MHKLLCNMFDYVHYVVSWPNKQGTHCGTEKNRWPDPEVVNGAPLKHEQGTRTDRVI